jgi:hypothetical protein
MRRILCNLCNKATELNEYGLPPEGWISIHIQAKSFQAPADLCGVLCALGYAKRLTLATPVDSPSLEARNG